MEKTISFELTESQAESFEKLLDEFNSATGHNKEKTNDETSGFQTETRLLLSQARKELEKIKQFNANQKKMIWEQ